MTVVLVLAGAAAVLWPVTIVVGLLEGHNLLRLPRPARPMPYRRRQALEARR